MLLTRRVAVSMGAAFCCVLWTSKYLAIKDEADVVDLDFMMGLAASDRSTT